MRTVAFVDRLEFNFDGNIFNNAIALGDVDNDDENELLVGNADGELTIYKGTDSVPWRKCYDMGQISVVVVADLDFNGKNSIIAITTAGWFYVFDVHSLETGTGYYHKQYLAPNAKCAILADIDGDGRKELVVGYFDRCVRAFRWQRVDTLDDSNRGEFVELHLWQLPGQVGAVTVNPVGDKIELLVSQPGGTFVQLHLPSEASELPTLTFHPLGSSRARNPGVSTTMVGNIRRTCATCSATTACAEHEDVTHYCAVCMLDGTLTLLDSRSTDNILWSLYVDHQLFALTKLDVTGDGTEEVVVCSWDGQTYIVNLKREVIRFHFPESVAAFCAGTYGVPGHGNVSVLVYFTFNNKVLVYYNLQKPTILTSDLCEQMEAKGVLEQCLSKLNIDGEKLTKQQKTSLYKWLLYSENFQNLTRRSSKTTK